MTALAAPASARLSEKTIKAECRDAGGRHSTGVVEGTRFSTCSYRSTARRDEDTDPDVRALTAAKTLANHVMALGSAE